MTSHKSGCSAEDSAMEDHRINLFRTADAFNEIHASITEATGMELVNADC